MGETISRIFSPPGSGDRGPAPQPVSRDSSDVLGTDAARRRAARVAFGQTRLTSGLGDTASNKPKLLGQVNSA